MVYVKIVIGSLIWVVILWNVGAYIFEQDRERICNHEVRKENPDKLLVKENCLATAEVYVRKEEYGSASWFYLLAGNIDKNVDDIEEEINDNFYINIGHSYVLKHDLKKAEKIYKNFIFSHSGGYLYTDVNNVVMEDYETLKHLYINEKEYLEKGLKLWEKVYAPVGKMVNAYAEYEKSESDYNTSASKLHLKEAIGYAQEYHYEKEVPFASWIETLGELYYDDEEYKEAIVYYTKASVLYKDNKEKQLSYADSLFWIAKSYYYLSDYETAIDYYKKSIPFYVEAESNSSYNIGYIYHNIGNSYREEENQTLQLEAISYYQKSIEHKKLYNAKEFDSLARSYSNMGDVYNHVKEYEKAKKAYEKAIELEKQMFKETNQDEMEESLNELDILASYHQDLSDTYQKLDDMNRSVEIQNDYLSFLEKHYVQHKLTLVEGYETVANYFQYQNHLLSLKYYKMALILLDKNNAKELLSEKEVLRGSILEDILYVSEEIGYTNPLEARGQLKELIAYQENHFPNNLFLAKSYFTLAYFSKDEHYAYEIKSLKLLQESILKEENLANFPLLVQYYDKYIEASIEKNKKENALELMNMFHTFVKTYYPEEKSVQFEFYASRSYMYKILAQYEHSIKDIIVASKLKDEAFKIDCQDLKKIYDICSIYIDKKSIPKLEKACETIL